MKKKIALFLIGLLFFSGLFLMIEKSSENSKHFTITSTTSTTSTTTQTNKQEKKHTVQSELPGGSVKDWNLLLVNAHNTVTDRQLNLTSLANGQQLDEKVYPYYVQLSEAARQAGYTLLAISGYRSVAYQQELLNNDIQSYLNQGYSQEEAKKKALEYMTEPGTSEHHTGLAIDVLEQTWYEKGNTLETGFGETKAGKWLAQNAATYGFIIRYPKGKEKVTGIQYEPWHLRFVGKENAIYMVKHQLVLEEYLALLKD